MAESPVDELPPWRRRVGIARRTGKAAGRTSSLIILCTTARSKRRCPVNLVRPAPQQRDDGDGFDTKPFRQACENPVSAGIAFENDRSLRRQNDIPVHERDTGQELHRADRRGQSRAQAYEWTPVEESGVPGQARVAFVRTCEPDTRP